MGALEIILERLRDGKEVQKDTVQKLVTFFDVFGDRYHHIKEEHVLIPRLEDACESRSRCHAGRTIGEIYYEHEEARRMLSEMGSTVENLDDPKARQSFIRISEEYITYMRAHISKEKTSLLGSASKMLRMKITKE